MENHPTHLLTILIFSPLAGVLALIPANRNQTSLIKGIGVISTIVTFTLSLYLFSNFSLQTPEIQFSENYSWIPEIGAHYFVGIDGITLPFILLTTFIFLIALICIGSKQPKVRKELIACLLVMECSTLGIFCSLDFFLFFIFWEVLPVTVGMLIGCWGEEENRMETSIKYFMYTVSGTLIFLGALLFMYVDNFSRTGVFSLSIFDYQNMPLEPSTRFWLFLALFIAFGIRLPVFPFHTWLPHAQKGGSVLSNILLSGIYLKIGIYGYLRFLLPLLGDTVFNFIPVMSWIAIAGILYCGLLACFQKTPYETIAYANISQMGLIALGVFAINIHGIQGALLQTVGHGLASTALILMVGINTERKIDFHLEEKKRTLGCLSSKVLFLIAIAAFAGLPGSTTFAGELLVLMGAFKSRPFYTIMASFGAILTLLYMLRLYHTHTCGLADGLSTRSRCGTITSADLLCLLPVIFLIFLLGLYPNLLLSATEPTVQNLIQQITPQLVQ